MKFLGFDIEISDVFDLKPGEDLLKYAPFHLSVAATLDSSGRESLWYSTDEHGTPAVEMTRAKAQELLAHLQAIEQEGYLLFAWNGLKFDLRWIGYNAGDMERAARLALGLYDPMFQFFNQRGFPISLEAVGKAMGVKQLKLMEAAEAPRQWRAGNYKRVMDYVLRDAQIMNQIIEAIAREGAIRWVTQRGTTSREPIPRFKTVAEVLRDPEPDQSWMSEGGLKRRTFVEWVPKHILKELV
jgi:hypothetical protein